MIQDGCLGHHLTYEQVKLLNRGLIYVQLCQIHILSKSSLTRAEIVTKQMVPLQRGLTNNFMEYPVALLQRIGFEKEIQ